LPTIRLPEGAIDVIETGTGRPLILLHSLLADRSIFDRVVPKLARTRRVVCPDLPGFGGSSAAGASISGIADRVALLFDALDLPRETDVLGNGFGGFVASTLAIRHGRRFDRLVLADTGLGFDEPGRAAFHGMAGRVRAGGMDAVIDIAMRRLFPDDFLAANPAILAERRAALLRTDPTLFAFACEALAALDLTSEIGGIRNPTLVLVGTLDAATPPPMSHALAAAIDGARLVELPGLGHAPMAQDPDAFLAAISAFLGLEPTGAEPQRVTA